MHIGLLGYEEVQYNATALMCVYVVGRVWRVCVCVCVCVCVDHHIKIRIQIKDESSSHFNYGYMASDLW